MTPHKIQSWTVHKARSAWIQQGVVLGPLKWLPRFPRGNGKRNLSSVTLGKKGALFWAWTILSGAATQKKGTIIGATEQLRNASSRYSSQMPSVCGREGATTQGLLLRPKYVQNPQVLFTWAKRTHRCWHRVMADVLVQATPAQATR